MSDTPQRVPMSGADAAWLHMDHPQSPMVIDALVTLEDPLAGSELRALLAERLVGVYPKFAMEIEEGSLPLSGPIWRRSERFRIENHLHHVALPSPGDERALMGLVSDLVSSPLPVGIPLWHAHLIERDGADTALLVRMHHCIADGIALAGVLASLTDGEDGAGSAPAAGTASGGGSGLRGLLGAAAHEGMETLLHPRRVLEAARDMEVLVRLLAARPDPTGQLKGALTGCRRVGWCEPLDLELVKSVAHRNGATVNDVLIAVLSGALRAEMMHRGRPGRRPPLRMRAIVPFNLRARGEPVPRELGNRFGMVFLEMPLAERDRRRRLRAVKADMDEIKRSPEGPVSYAVLQAMGAAGQRLEGIFVEIFTSKGTAVITNVPGPAHQRRLAGARVQSLYVWAPTSGSVGVSVSILSYNGAVTVGLMADVSLIADPAAIAARVPGELEALAALKGQGVAA